MLLPPIKLPVEKKWPQLNKGDLFGAISASRNIDLSDPGILRLAQRTKYVGQTTADLIDILAIVYGNFQSFTSYYFITSSKIFVSKFDLSTFAIDGNANSPTLFSGSDGVIWGQAMYVSKTARVSKFAVGAWTSDWSTSDFDNTIGNVPHPLEPNVTNANLLGGDYNLLKAFDSSGVQTTALTLPSSLIITWIRRGVNVNYIGCRGRAGDPGAVVVWDGLATTTGANAIIYMDSGTQPLSGVVDEDGILNVVTSDGRLMRFNGNSFSYLAELPPFRDFKLRFPWGGSLDEYNIGVLQRGTALVRGKIHVQVNAAMNTNDAELINPNFQSGTWVYDKDNNAFYHKAAPSNSNTITDFGQSHGSAMVSAIAPIGYVTGFGTYPPAGVGGSFITGASLYPNTVAGTVLRTVVSQTTGLNRGSISTVRVETSNVSDNNIAIWCKYHGINTIDDKIVFKYRNKKRDPFTITNSVATWVDATSFTSTDTKIADAIEGDEITVLTGNGAGCTAHITDISLNAGTYTVTLDENITGISLNDTGYIMFDSWIKLPTQITFTDTDGYKRIPIITSPNPKWIEIKVEMRGEGGVVGIEELALVNNSNIPIQ